MAEVVREPGGRPLRPYLPRPRSGRDHVILSARPPIAMVSSGALTPPTPLQLESRRSVLALYLRWLKAAALSSLDGPAVAHVVGSRPTSEGRAGHHPCRRASADCHHTGRTTTLPVRLVFLGPRPAEPDFNLVVVPFAVRQTAALMVALRKHSLPPPSLRSSTGREFDIALRSSRRSRTPLAPVEAGLGASRPSRGINRRVRPPFELLSSRRPMGSTTPRGCHSGRPIHLVGNPMIARCLPTFRDSTRAIRLELAWMTAYASRHFTGRQVDSPNRHPDRAAVNAGPSSCRSSSRSIPGAGDARVRRLTSSDRYGSSSRWLRALISSSRRGLCSPTAVHPEERPPLRAVPDRPTDTERRSRSATGEPAHAGGVGRSPADPREDS